jgi:hypothetical protein
MKTRYDEPSIRISTIITDQEHSFRWGKTRRSHERFSRRKWDRSWRYRRSVDCTTATNDGPPEKARIYLATRMLSLGHWNLCPNCAPLQTRVHRLISFTRLRQGRKLDEVCSPVGGMTSQRGCTEYTVDTTSQLLAEEEVLSGQSTPRPEAGPDEPQGPGNRSNMVSSTLDRIEFGPQRQDRTPRSLSCVNRGDGIIGDDRGPCLQFNLEPVTLEACLRHYPKRRLSGNRGPGIGR